jgi:hypothetical protein
MAAVADRLARPFPPKAIKPLDRHGFTDLVPARCAATAYRAPLDRIDHTVAQILRIRFRHPCCRPANRLSQNKVDSRIPSPIQANVTLL